MAYRDLKKATPELISRMGKTEAGWLSECLDEIVYEGFDGSGSQGDRLILPIKPRVRQRPSDTEMKKELTTRQILMKIRDHLETLALVELLK